MTSPDSKKFIVMYLIPTAVMDDWKKIDPGKEEGGRREINGGNGARGQRITPG